MSESQRLCLRCNSPMEPGILDDTGESSKGRTRWIPGALEVGLFGGTKKFGKPRLEVTAFRCVTCGMLDLVAHTFQQIPTQPPPPRPAPTQPNAPADRSGSGPVIAPSAWPNDRRWPDS